MGNYLVTMSGCVAISGSPGSGSITNLEAGIYQGQNSTILSNLQWKYYSSQSTYTISNGLNGDRNFSFSYPIAVQNNFDYVAGSASYTLTVMGAGTSQLIITTFSIIRTG